MSRGNDPEDDWRHRDKGMSKMEWLGENCRSCGRGYSDVWSVPDDVWLAVVGHGGSLRCTTCFTKEAAAKGIKVELSPPIYETPPMGKSLCPSCNPDAFKPTHGDKGMSIEEKIERAKQLALEGSQSNIPDTTHYARVWAINEYNAALRAEGLVIIPREPTEEMLAAAFGQANDWLMSGEGNEECRTDEERSAKAIRPLYRAMIAAAIKPGGREMSGCPKCGGPLKYDAFGRMCNICGREPKAPAESGLVGFHLVRFRRRPTCMEPEEDGDWVLYVAAAARIRELEEAVQKLMRAQADYIAEMRELKAENERLRERNKVLEKRNEVLHENLQFERGD